MGWKAAVSALHHLQICYLGRSHCAGLASPPSRDWSSASASNAGAANVVALAMGHGENVHTLSSEEPIIVFCNLKLIVVSFVFFL